MLFKHLQVLKSYLSAFEGFAKKIRNYAQEKEMADEHHMKTTELGEIQKTIHDIAQKTADYEIQFEEVDKAIEGALETQFSEYITSVDQVGGHGVNTRLKKRFQQVEDAIDSLIKHVEKEAKEAEDFSNNFLDELARKDMFYQQLNTGKDMGDMENSSLDDDPKKQN